MSVTGWRPDSDEEDPNRAIGFSDALAEFVVKDASEIDPVDAVRESGEDV